MLNTNTIIQYAFRQISLIEIHLCSKYHTCVYIKYEFLKYYIILIVQNDM